MFGEGWRSWRLLLALKAFHLLWDTMPNVLETNEKTMCCRQGGCTWLPILNNREAYHKTVSRSRPGSADSLVGGGA